MSNFIPESDDLWKALIFCCHLKKSAAELEATCKRCFQKCGKWVANELQDRWKTEKHL